MQELEAWFYAEISEPLLHAGARSAEDSEFDWETPVATALKAVKKMVLDSYHNGQAAGPRKAQPPVRRWQRQPEYQR